MSEGDGDFLGRWSRRKAEARDGGLRKKADLPDAPSHKPGRMRTDPLPPKAADVESKAAEDEAIIQEAALREESAEDQVPEVIEERPDAEASTAETEDAKPEDFENFDFDSLNYDSDYTRFMNKGVPEAVRKRALRMLWGSNPILANIDGLNDYDDDFTDAALAVKGLLKTSYNAKTGYLTEKERLDSYSEEARNVGSDAPKGDEETEVAETRDADSVDGGSDTPDKDVADDGRQPEDLESADAGAEDEEGEDDDLGEGDGDGLA